MASVLVPLAQGCEELEAVTVVDLLRRADVDVVTAGLDDQPVRASRGVVLIPDAALGDVLNEGFDMIVLPGGEPGATNLASDERVVALVRQMARVGQYTAAICAAPKVFAESGILDGRRATSFPGALERAAVPGLDYVEDPVVIDGKIITSRGPGTAMDFALQLVELLVGVAKRQEVEARLQRSTRH
jgi:4-methyl-5(b-hydroxyethyl)-thiazole monophosphate biosynthesis